MFNKNEWKKEIFKEDLKKVILIGLLMAILGGALSSVLDYSLNKIHITISFGVIIYAILIGIMIRRSYVNYHILYPVLGIVFMIVASIISRLLYPFIIYFNFSEYFNYLGSPNVWLNIIFGPIYSLATRFGASDYIYIILGFLIHFALYFLCYRLAKGNN